MPAKTDVQRIALTEAFEKVFFSKVSQKLVMFSLNLSGRTKLMIILPKSNDEDKSKPIAPQKVQVIADVIVNCIGQVGKVAKREEQFQNDFETQKRVFCTHRS